MGCAMHSLSGCEGCERRGLIVCFIALLPKPQALGAVLADCCDGNGLATDCLSIWCSQRRSGLPQRVHGYSMHGC